MRKLFLALVVLLSACNPPALPDASADASDDLAPVDVPSAPADAGTDAALDG